MDSKKIPQKIATPLYKRHDFVAREDGVGFNEFIMAPRNIIDSKEGQKTEPN